MSFFHFNKKFFSIFALILILLFLQTLNQNQNQDPLTKISHFLFSEAQTAGVNLHRNIVNTLKKYLFLLSLHEQNTHLKKQNQELQTKYQVFQEVLIENERLKKLKDFPLNKAYQLLPAQITSTDFLSANEILNINKGSLHGVKKFMGVLHPKGVVGHIFRVSPHSSQVLTLLSPLSSLPARNQRSRIKGLVEAHQKNLLVFHYIGEQESLKIISKDLKVGDKIVARQSDQMPAGFLIGQIHLLDKSSQTLNPKVYLQPAVSFSALEEVLIVLNLEQIEKVKPQKIDFSVEEK